MQPKRLDDALMGREDIVNAPEADESLQVQALAPTASQPLGSASTPIFTDEAASRHGRIAAKSFGIGYKNLVKEELDGDIRDTMGDAMGEIFNVVSRTGKRFAYWMLLGVALLPLLAVMFVRAMDTLKEKEGES